MIAKFVKHNVKYMKKCCQGKFLRSLSYGANSEYVEKKPYGIDKITVLGGGIMGAGIAQSAAQSGFPVTVVADDEYSQKCLVSISRSLDIIAKKKFPDEPKGAKKFRDNVFEKITTVQDIGKGCDGSDLVIEAVVEDLNVKQNLFKKADIYSPSDAIFVSNTSSLSIQDIAEVTSRKEKFAGLHFFNPVWGMQLVEVITTTETSQDTYNTLMQFSEDLGKTPVKSPDSNGFIVNRLLFPYMMEALRFYERGHASIVDIDTAMKHGASVPMGPFELMDVIGLDIVKKVIDGWHKKDPENPLFFSSEMLNKLVLEGKLGRKSGVGFYKYKHTMF